MSTPKSTVTLVDTARASYRIAQDGHAAILISASAPQETELLDELIEAFGTGACWLGSRKATSAHLLDAAGFDDAHYDGVELFEKADAGAGVSWLELVLTLAVGQQRPRVTICFRDVDLAMDVLIELGFRLEVALA